MCQTISGLGAVARQLAETPGSDWSQPKNSQTNVLFSSFVSKYNVLSEL